MAIPVYPGWNPMETRAQAAYLSGLWLEFSLANGIEYSNFNQLNNIQKMAWKTFVKKNQVFGNLRISLSYEALVQAKEELSFIEANWKAREHHKNFHQKVRVPAMKFRALRVLNLTIGATPEEIKKAYREALKRTHPDHGGSSEQLKMVQEAYDELCRF
jgi:hypothetical protein